MLSCVFEHTLSTNDEAAQLYASLSHKQVVLGDMSIFYKRMTHRLQYSPKVKPWYILLEDQ